MSTPRVSGFSPDMLRSGPGRTTVAYWSSGINRVWFARVPPGRVRLPDNVSDPRPGLRVPGGGNSFTIERPGEDLLHW